MWQGFAKAPRVDRSNQSLFLCQIIYTIFNRNFRRAFKRILSCQICGHSPPNRRFSRTTSQRDYHSTATLTGTASSSTPRTTRSTKIDMNQSPNTYRAYTRPVFWKFNTIRTDGNCNSRNQAQKTSDNECSL